MRVKPWHVRVASLAIYLPVAGLLVWLSGNQINPDGVAYIQVARHWSAGQSDLAINSWWGPLLSWLLVPAIRLGWDPLLTAKSLGVLLGVLTAIGASRIATLLMRSANSGKPPGGGTGTDEACRSALFEDGKATFAALAPSLCFSSTLAIALTMLPEPVTPDLLMTCIVTWYFVASLAWLREGRMRDIVLAGALGGLAYMTKSYGLPFVGIHLVLTAWMRRRAVKRGMEVSPASCPPSNSAERQALPLPQGETRAERRSPVLGVLLGLVALAIVAGPWVAVVSSYSGKPTIGCAGEYARRAFDPVALRNYDLPIFDLQVPREGRLTVWENGLETKRDWPNWTLASRPGIVRMAKDLGYNLLEVVCIASQPKWAGWMWVSAAVVLAALVVRRLRGPLLWAVLSGLLYGAGYLPLTVYDRYLWPAWPLQVAMVLLLVSMAPGTLGRGWSDGKACRLALFDCDKTAALSRPNRLAQAALIVTLASLVFGGAWTLWRWSEIDGVRAKYAAIRQAGELVAAQGKPFMASTEWHQGLFAAYWGNVQYINQTKGKSAEAVAAELSPFGPTCLLAFDDEALEASLAGSSQFHKVGQTAGGGTRIGVFSYVGK